MTQDRVIHDTHLERAPVFGNSGLENHLIFRITQAANDLVQTGRYLAKKRRSEKVGCFARKELMSREMKSKSVEQEKRIDKLETLSLDHWSRQAASQSSGCSPELNDKHKNFVTALGEKTSVNTEQNLEEQKNKFLINLSNISKCFKSENQIRDNSKEQLKNDFWKRRKLAAAQANMSESSNLMENNREVFNNMAAKKFMKVVEELKSAGVRELDEEELNRIAIDVMDQLLNKLAPNYQSFKKSEALNNFKETQRSFISNLIDSVERKERTTDEFVKKSPYNYTYLKYLKKRSLR